MSTMPPVPFKTPLTDRSGMPSQVWADFFQKLLVRVGGKVALSNDELEIVGTARIVDAAVTSAKIASSVAGDGLSGGAGTPLSVNTDDSTIEKNLDALRVKDNGISFPKLLSTDWTNSIAGSGYQKLPSGLYFQWGTTGSLTSASTTSTSFPVAFPTACLHVFLGIRNNSAVATTATGQFGTGNYSATAFDLYNRTSVSHTFNWIAVGH